MIYRSLFLVLLLFFIISCRPIFQDDEAELDLTGPGHISFWVAMSKDEIESVRKISDKFHKETDITVDVREIGLFEITTKLELSAPAGKGPDVFSISHTSVGALALMGLLMPIEEIPERLKNYPESLTSAFYYQGKLYGVPLTVESYGLVVNRDIVDEVPDTWEDLIGLAENLTVDKDGDGAFDTYGFLTDPENFYFTFPFYDAMGGYIFGGGDTGLDPKDLGFCTPGGISALKFIVDLTREKNLIPRGIDYPIISDLFAKGKVAMMIHGTYLIGYYRSLGIDVGYSPLPRFSDGRQGRPLSTLMGIGISSYSEKKDIAQRFLNYFLEPENLRIYFESSGGIRVMADPTIYDEEDFKREPALETAITITENSYPYPNDPRGDLIWDAVRDAAYLAIEEKTSPEEALCDMQNRLKTIFSEMEE